MVNYKLILAIFWTTCLLGIAGCDSPVKVVTTGPEVQYRSNVSPEIEEVRPSAQTTEGTWVTYQNTEPVVETNRPADPRMTTTTTTQPMTTTTQPMTTTTQPTTTTTQPMTTTTEPQPQPMLTVTRSTTIPAQPQKPMYEIYIMLKNKEKTDLACEAVRSLESQGMLTVSGFSAPDSRSMILYIDSTKPIAKFADDLEAIWAQKGIAVTCQIQPTRIIVMDK